MPIAADDSDDVFDHGALTPPASPRTLWAPASGSGDVITIDAAIKGALDVAAFAASCGARISVAADANDVLGDEYNAGAYVALCRVLLAASTSGRMEYVSPSRRLVPPTSPPNQRWDSSYYAAGNCDPDQWWVRLLCGIGWTPFV